jgi:hypothetical protein
VEIFLYPALPVPRIIVETLSADQPIEVALSERIVTANLDSEHYRSQLIERLAWATADAEELETRAAEAHNASTDEHDFIRPPFREALQG